MTTAIEVITSALDEGGVIASGEPISADEAATSLAVLNTMLHGFKLDYGIDLGHSDLALADTITLPADHIRAVELNLTLALAAKFSMTLAQTTVTFAERGLRALQGEYSQVPELTFDRALQSRVRNAGSNERFSG